MNSSNSKKLALWWNRLINRNKRNSQSLFISKKGKTPKQFLIILPEHSTESDLAKRFLRSMRNAMGPAGSNQVRLLGLESVGSLVDSSDFHHYIFFTKEDLNRWGTPDKELTYACEKITVDVVLDLNQEFSLFSAALSKIVSAPLRIGFYSKEGKDYYNIMIRRQGEELAESGFKEIFQIIGI